MNLLARLQLLRTIKPIKVTLHVVTLKVTFAVERKVPAPMASRAIRIRRRAQRTISSVKVTSLVVAFRVALSVLCLARAVILNAILLFNNVIHCVVVGLRFSFTRAVVWLNKAARERRVVEVAISASPGSWTVADVVTGFVEAIACNK